MGGCIRCEISYMLSFLWQEVRKINESIKYNHPLRKNVDTILRKVRHRLIWTYGCFGIFSMYVV